MIKRIVKRGIKALGFQLVKIQNTSGNKTAALANSPDTMQRGLKRSQLRGINPNTVIDVGAAQGDWTLAAMDIWKGSQYLLMEPLQEREARLTQLQKNNHNIHVVNAAAGDKKGVIPFFVAEDLDGSGVADNGSPARTIEVTTIDEEIKRLQLQGPYLIKLDTHGYEVPILAGAVETLKNTSLIIIECYGFQIAPQSLVFWEMCRLMQEKGFRLVDVVDIMRRKKDYAFWQCDAFFISINSSVFNSNSFY